MVVPHHLNNCVLKQFHFKRVESCGPDRCGMPTFIAVLFTMVKKWKQPTCLSMDEWIKTMCIYGAILFSLKKEGDSDTCYNTNES